MVRGVRVKRLFLSWIALCALLVACGGAKVDKGPVLPVPPPQAVLGLTFLFVPAHGSEVWTQPTNDAVEAGFIKAGYKLTTEPNDLHDATIAVALTATEKPSFLTIYKNGQRQVDYLVRVNLTVKDASGVVDIEMQEIATSGEQVDASEGLHAVNALSDAMRFKIWAMKLVSSRAAPAASDSASAAPAASATP